MIIAIPSKGESISSKADDRFGRADYFIIIEDDKVSFIENQAKEQASGAGFFAVKTLSEKGVNIVLAPELGPKAFKALKEFEIKAYKYSETKSVQEILEEYKAGKLKSI